MTLRASSSLRAREADVELLAEVLQRGFGFALPLAERLVLVRERARTLLAARELLFHFAHGVLQQHVGLFDAVEHGMHVGREQPRHSIDERHGICLLATEVNDAEATLGTPGAALYRKNAKRRLHDLHARYIRAAPRLARAGGMARARASMSMARDGLALGRVLRTDARFYKRFTRCAAASC